MASTNRQDLLLGKSGTDGSSPLPLVGDGDGRGDLSGGGTPAADAAGTAAADAEFIISTLSPHFNIPRNRGNSPSLKNIPSAK